MKELSNEEMMNIDGGKKADYADYKWSGTGNALVYAGEAAYNGGVTIYNCGVWVYNNIKEAKTIMNERKVTINMRRLYILSTIGGIALQIVSYHLWCIMWENPFLSSFGIHKITYSEAESYFTRKILIFIALLIIGVILHELIHGITWALFSPRHFKDIKFRYNLDFIHAILSL